MAVVNRVSRLAAGSQRMTTDAASSAIEQTAAPPGSPVGYGEMDARIRAFSWAATPLGPMAAWPQSLKTAVDIALDSAFPTFIWWGPELTQLSNDAAIAVLRAKHPAALGRPALQVWSEICEDVGPLFTSVLETGELSTPPSRRRADSSMRWASACAICNRRMKNTGTGSMAASR
jgi:hypothetical protein